METTYPYVRQLSSLCFDAYSEHTFRVSGLSRDIECLVRDIGGFPCFAFRGTEIDEIKDLITDMRAFPSPRAMATRGVLAHAGAYAAARKAAEKISELSLGRECVLCGHSLGGMVALCSLLVLGKEKVGKVVLFGTPACVRGSVPMPADGIVSVQNARDPIARVNPWGLYSHPKERWYISPGGAIFANRPGDLRDGINTVTAFLRQVDHLPDHSIARYREVFARLAPLPDTCSA